MTFYYHTFNYNDQHFFHFNVKIIIYTYDYIFFSFPGKTRGMGRTAELGQR